MTDPFANLRLVHRHARLRVGLLAGAVLGPLIGCTLLLLPRNDLLGAYPPYADDFMPLAAFIGLCSGVLAGLAITLLARTIQRWIWTRRGGALPRLDSPQSAIGVNADVHIMPPPGPIYPPDDRITPASE
jgi:hypothetical protein